MFSVTEGTFAGNGYINRNKQVLLDSKIGELMGKLLHGGGEQECSIGETLTFYKQV